MWESPTPIDIPLWLPGRTGYIPVHVTPYEGYITYNDIVRALIRTLYTAASSEALANSPSAHLMMNQRTGSSHGTPLLIDVYPSNHVLGKEILFRLAAGRDQHIRAWSCELVCCIGVEPRKHFFPV